MSFDDDFKQALKHLSSTEKDKLILRLLKRDIPLANKLYFELVDTDSAEEKREQLKARVTKDMERASARYNSPGYLLMDTRNISGSINEHVAMTRDKLGEVSLNCLLIRTLLEKNNGRIAAERYGKKSYSLFIYIIARIFKIMILMQKQHEDMHLEFKDDIMAIGELVGQNPNLMRVAIHNGLDVNWLVQFNIPNDIADIYKELRSKGLLR